MPLPIKKSNDVRIGTRTPDGAYASYPTRFANGYFWDRSAMPDVTYVYFGSAEQFFYVLPVGQGNITSELRAQLEAIAEPKAEASSHVESAPVVSKDVKDAK